MKRVLLVDDQPEVLHSVRHMLAAHFEVDLATTAQQAAVLLDDRSYDAVVTDFTLPDQSGVWLLRYAMSRRPAARRVLTSGDPAGALAGSGVAHAFLQKPAKLHDLLAAIDPSLPRR